MDATGVVRRPLSRLARFSRRHKGPTAFQANGAGYIGLDFADAELRAVQLERFDDGLKLRAVARQNYPCSLTELLKQPTQFRRFVQSTLKEGRFLGQDVVTFSPRADLRVFSVDYPINEKLGEEAVIMNAVIQRVDDDPADLVIDYMQMRTASTNDMRKALVAVARFDTQRVWLEQLRRAGLNVCALEIPPVALRRLMATLDGEQSTDNLLTINVGRHHSYLTVTAGRRLLLDRQIQFGEDMLVEQVALALEMSQQMAKETLLHYGLARSDSGQQVLDGLISEDDIRQALADVVTPVCNELAREVRKVFAYVHAQLRGAAIKQIFLSGRATNWPGAPQFLTRLMGTDVALLDPLSALTWEAPRTISPAQSASSLVLAYGAALRPHA